MANRPVTQISGQQHDLTIVAVLSVGRLHFTDGSDLVGSLLES
jgi:hypothetical protein